MLEKLMVFVKGPGHEAERQKALHTAKLVVELEQTEGWKEFVKLAEGLISSMTPEPAYFDAKQATQIAAQMTFVSGIKRCLGLMDQQKSILGSLKKPENN